MICKHCGAHFAGSRCPSCGQEIQLIECSQELDRLMKKNKGQEAGQKTDYQEGLRKGYENGFHEGEKKGRQEGYRSGYQKGREDAADDAADDTEPEPHEPPVESRGLGKKTVFLLCLISFIAAAALGVMVGGAIRYQEGFRRGKDEGIRIAQRGAASDRTEPEALPVSEKQRTERTAQSGEEQSGGQKEPGRDTDPDRKHAGAETDLPGPEKDVPEASVPAEETPGFAGPSVVPETDRSDPEQNVPAASGPEKEMPDFPYSMERCGKNQSERVKDIQAQLNKKGFDAGRADGFFGPKTMEAVRRFQEKENLPVSGAVDRDTYDRLFSQE